MNIARNIERARLISPEQPALLFEGESLTYRELDQMANRVAQGLHNLGVTTGDRVSLLLPNTPTWAFVYLGVQKIGAVAVSLNPALKPEEASFIINDSGPRVLVTTSALRRSVADVDLACLEHCVVADEYEAPGCIESNQSHESGACGSSSNSAGSASNNTDIRLAELISGTSDEFEAVEMGHSSPSAIVYTSGTTGFPKGASLSHGNVVSNVEAKKRYLGIGTEDRLLLFLPLFHCFGQNAVFNSGICSGATIVLHRKFDPERVSRSINQDTVTMFFGIPASYMILYERLAPQDMDSVRYCFSAAANLPSWIERKWQEKFGLVINQGYGLSETSPFASYNHQTRHKPGSIGTPIDGVEMRIVDPETGVERAIGEPGEIVIRGPNVMLGYWNQPEATAESIRDGWFHTGDIGRMDEEGYFYIEDRLKDMINVGGLKVYPAEVENAIYQHPAVAEVAVFGVPDPVLGEHTVANVVRKAGCEATESEVIAMCRTKIAAYKVPVSVQFVDSIPKNPAGKILKRVLREQSLTVDQVEGKTADVSVSSHADIAGNRDSIPDAGAISDWIAGWMAAELEVDPSEIKTNKSFFDYGMDSIGALKLTRALCEWLNRPVEAPLIWSFATVQALSNHLAIKPGESGSASATGSPLGESQLSTHDEVRSLDELSESEIGELLREEIKAVRQRTSK